MEIANLSLAEIVTAKPAAAAIFEHHQLDFCCKGKQKLDEALHGDKTKLASLLDRLQILFAENNSVDVNFNNYSLSELMDYIVKHHHQYVKDNMPVIQQHIRKVVSKHGENFPYLKKVEVIFEEVCIDFTQHMMKEELILFPKIKRMEIGSEVSDSIETIINVMEMEHKDAGHMMDEIKKISSNYTVPENACITFKLCLEELRLFEEDLHKHVHLENNILFPKAIELQNNNSSCSCSCSI